MELLLVLFKLLTDSVRRQHQRLGFGGEAFRKTNAVSLAFEATLFKKGPLKLWVEAHLEGVIVVVIILLAFFLQ